MDMSHFAMRAWASALLAAGVFVASAFATSARAALDEVSLPSAGVLKIEASLRVAKGTYIRAPASDDPAAANCVMRAVGVHGATIDLRGVELRGSPVGTELEHAEGIGLHLVDCSDITVVGGTFAGFKGCIVAERCRGLRIENVRFDGYFAQRLLSTEAAEHPADDLAPRDNDKGEWVTNYGAALALDGCDGAVIVGCRARHGQNGLLLRGCTNARVYDNDFSFLSGWGIALYRSSDNVIARNRCDFCVRGYSDGRFARGQGAAGILLFERSCDNVIAANSATHGGNGLYLFAGRDLVDGKARERGEQAAGGSDRNLILGNDFSCAVVNGIECTFSGENRVIENVAEGCRQHGLSGGYSSRMTIIDNSFNGAGVAGIAIAHGQECMIARNLIERCELGLELSWNAASPFVDGAFGARRDTSSRDHRIIGNSFAENAADLALEHTSGLWFWENVFAASKAQLACTDVTLAPGESASGLAPQELVRGLAGIAPTGRMSAVTLRVADDSLPDEWRARMSVEAREWPGTTRPFDPARKDRPGLDAIVVGEWGPWDFESGEARPRARAVAGLLAAASWRARWFRWEPATDPRGDAATQQAWRALAQTPRIGAEIGVWSDPWGSREDVREALGVEHFGLLATTDLELPAGRYRLRVHSDDGVRVRVDGVRVIDNWSWHAEVVDEATLELAAGVHAFDVEYFQIDGAAALALDLLRR